MKRLELFRSELYQKAKGNKETMAAKECQSFSHISQQFATFSCNFLYGQTYLTLLTVAIVSVLTGLDSRICVKFPTTFCRHSKERKFYTLHDNLCRIDILEETWKNVAANHGTAGIDGQTIDGIKAYETDIFLKNLRQELVS